jgi:RNA polymerase sigma factor (sigma-70 family)
VPQARVTMQLTRDEVAESYRRFGTLVLRRCRRLLHGHEDARDVQQEVFVRLWRYGLGYREAGSKLAFLYRITDRCCFDLLSRRGARAEAPLVEAAAESLVTGPLQRDQVEHKDLAQHFLSRFTDRVKQVAVHHYLDGMTQEEIASATGWSRQTVIQKLGLLRRRAAALRHRLWGGGR